MITHCSMLNRKPAANLDEPAPLTRKELWRYWIRKYLLFRRIKRITNRQKYQTLLAWDYAKGLQEDAHTFLKANEYNPVTEQQPHD